MNYRNWILLLVWLLPFGIKGQGLNATFFEDVDRLLKQHVQEGRVNYKTLKSDPLLKEIMEAIAAADLKNEDKKTRKAFCINAYNMLVINRVVQSYPVTSVQTINGFFDKIKHPIAGEQWTLVDLEAQKLTKPHSDPRIHFVLNCGAVDCPPITNFAYTPADLDAQLEQQTKAAINDPNFIKVDKDNAALSQIFKWYQADFGGNTKSVLNFINQYSTTPIPDKIKITYYPYDWMLNDTKENASSNNSARYVVSATIPKGRFEFKWFNNLYTQSFSNSIDVIERSTFFTSSLSALYGVNHRFNAGLDIKYRRVENDTRGASAFHVFSEGLPGKSRTGITGIGPKIRYAPFPSLPNLSIQSTLYFPIGEDLQGTNTQPFIDWDGMIFSTQIFNDHSIGSKFSLFTSLDLIWEGIGNFNRFSTPVTAIFNYFPHPNTTLYFLANASPFYTPDLDYFAQTGLGFKYQFSPNLEIELLGTLFTNAFLQEESGNASTLNIGLRYNY